MIEGALSDASPLPRVREDLRLYPAASRSDGSKAWLIHDPVANKYQEVGIESYAALRCWAKCTTVGELRAEVQGSWGTQTSLGDVTSLLKFLDENNLLVESMGGWRGYSARSEQGKRGAFGWLLHNYLYFQIPLVRPYALLKRTLPYVEWAFSTRFYAAVAVLTLVGLYLVSRQWEAFMASFSSLMNIEGAVLLAVAVTFVKILHELGHAFAAARFGCRVPTMGVAIVMMLPLLYTDVTGAWTLPRRQRMLIDAAGVLVELTLAGIATILWTFLPDGQGRSLAFLIATSSWITSILINLNPLMRFDGYFLLSDWIGISNLQQRANAMGRWRLRELLFGLGEQPPERLPLGKHVAIIIYAWTLWLYRLIVFTGIALTVYHLFFKALGLLLFAVEITWFILKPVVSEIQHWWTRRSSIVTTRRSIVTGVAAVVLCFVLLMPWSTSVSVPAVKEHAVFARVFPGHSALLKSVLVAQGQTIDAGATLFELDDPLLRQNLRLVTLKLNLMRVRLGRRIADQRDRASTLEIEREIAALEVQQSGLQRQINELKVTAPINGQIVELNDELQPGRWIGRGEELAIIVAPGAGDLVSGYVSGEDLGRIAAGSGGRFIPDDPLAPPQSVIVEQIAYSGSEVIDIPYLASTYGGAIAVKEDAQRRLVPTTAAHLVTLKPVGDSPELGHVMRGVVVLDGEAESVFFRFWRRALNVLIRESGA